MQHTWVIGAGGLLGSAIHRQVPNPFNPQAIPWHDPDQTVIALTKSLSHFAKMANGEPWRIIWAAGRATTAASLEEATQELRIYERFIEALCARPFKGEGSFTLVSSAGGVYAGSENPPFTRLTEARPIGIYGNLKLHQEYASRQLNEQGVSTTITRVSNLYGPGQNLRKLQGVVSRLCLAAIHKKEVNIFVPLDTLRDYIYVDDAACRILHWSSTQPSNHQPESTVRVVASGQPIGLGKVIKTVQQVLRTRIPVSFGSHQSASDQAVDVRMIPDLDATLAGLPITPFPAGVRRVFEDILRKQQTPMLGTKSLRPGAL